jgi:hypothetical protein
MRPVFRYALGLDPCAALAIAREAPCTEPLFRARRAPECLETTLSNYYAKCPSGWIVVLAMAYGVGLAGTAQSEEIDHSQHDHRAETAEPDVASGFHDHTKPRPDSHAPIGVMGDHLHAKGEFMASYRYMRMSMEGNRIGTRDVPATAVVAPVGSYGVAPLQMDMEMHMFGLMWAPSDWVTLAGMFPYVRISMDHVNFMGVPFTTESSSIGDIGAAALVKLFSTTHHDMHANIGMTFPTGSIDRKDTLPTPAGPMESILTYPMQTGSGTWDFKPGVTYNGHSRLFSWGAQAMGTIRFGTNDENYRLGHNYELTAWAAWKAFDWLSLSGRGLWKQWWDIVGQDDRLQSPMPARWPTAADFVPTADPDLRAGHRLDLGPSANFVVTGGTFKGLRFAVEALFPVYQNLDGPQLATDWTVIVGTQYPW